MSLHLITGYAGQAHITAADHASFNMGLLGSGDFVLDRGNKFEASIISNNLIRILDGDLIIQGRHIRLQENTYEELEIENGTQGMYRNDLILVRYEKNATTGVEQCRFLVRKGTESETTAVDPSYPTGDISEQENDLVTEFLLYRVRLEGLNIVEVRPMFRVEKLLVDGTVPVFKQSMPTDIGWYRIAELKCATSQEANGSMNNSCDIEIKRGYNSKQTEYKRIQLVSIYQSTTFCNEISKGVSNAHVITKIRQTVDTATNKTYIEMYYSSDTSNTVCVTLSNHKNTNNRKWELIEPELTEETVDGVTVLGSHDFSLNYDVQTQIDNLEEFGYWIPNVDTYTADRCYYIKTKKMLTIYFSCVLPTTLSSAYTLGANFKQLFGVKNFKFAFTLGYGLQRKIFTIVADQSTNVLKIEKVTEDVASGDWIYGQISCYIE